MKPKISRCHWICQCTLALVACVILLFWGCSADEKEVNLNGHWVLSEGYFQVGNSTIDIPNPIGSLVLQDDSYELSFEVVVNYATAEQRVSREESGTCTLYSHYRDVSNATSPNYWYGSISFSPDSGTRWRTDFLCFDEPQGCFEFTEIPLNSGSLKLVWTRA